MNIYTQVSQVRVLFQKNVLTMKKGTLTFALNCLVLPFLAGFICKFIEYNPMERLHPPITPITGVERCSKVPTPYNRCMNIAYSPLNDSTKKIVENMVTANKHLDDD